MELDFNKIIRLKKIRIEKSELSEEENALTAPILKDKSLIHEIYKIFIELLNERGCPPNIDSVTQRKKFIFNPQNCCKSHRLICFAIQEKTAEQ